MAAEEEATYDNKLHAANTNHQYIKLDGKIHVQSLNSEGIHLPTESSRKSTPNSLQQGDTLSYTNSPSAVSWTRLTNDIPLLGVVEGGDALPDFEEGALLATVEVHQTERAAGVVAAGHCVLHGGAVPHLAHPVCVELAHSRGRRRTQ